MKLLFNKVELNGQIDCRMIGWLKIPPIFAMLCPTTSGLLSVWEPWNVTPAPQPLLCQAQLQSGQSEGDEAAARSDHQKTWDDWDVNTEVSLNLGTPKMLVYNGTSIYKWMMTGGTPMTLETSMWLKNLVNLLEPQNPQLDVHSPPSLVFCVCLKMG